MTVTTRARSRCWQLRLVARGLVVLALMPGAEAAAPPAFAHIAPGPAQVVPARRIVSLAPNLTEIAFVAGAGDLLVGTIGYSDYPEAARAVPRIGDAFRVDFEKVLTLQPDVILAWESGTPKPVIERLRALHLRVQVFSMYRVVEVARVVREVGELAGTSSVADPVAMRFEQGFKGLRQEYRGRAPLSVFIQISGQPLYTVNGRQIISEIVELCGGRNVFARLNDLAPQIGIESVIAENPQVILAVDETVTDIAADWRRWNGIEAVRTGNLFALSPDELARATPRLLDGARNVCRALETARQRRG